MNINIIVPTNNAQEINNFIFSLDKMKKFKKHATLIIIGNGNVHYDSILGGHSVKYEFIRSNNDYSNELINFYELRLEGMKNSNCDYFLFLDDDHRFGNLSDSFLISCIKILEYIPECTVLWTDQDKKDKTLKESR